ncbi:hypothetical protein [Paenibacillus sp. FSL R7-0302]|uniref:hypothetical protein n=1 Tax=Paenibacillus sp. FSL R7-0302 TaxID=2921681 RepID=UPI004046BFAB
MFAYLKECFGMKRTRHWGVRASVDFLLSTLAYNLSKFALDKLNQLRLLLQIPANPTPGCPPAGKAKRRASTRRRRRIRKSSFANCQPIRTELNGNIQRPVKEDTDPRFNNLDV